MRPLRARPLLQPRKLLLLLLVPSLPSLSASFHRIPSFRPTTQQLAMGNRNKLVHFLRLDPAAAASALSSPRSVSSSSSSSFSDDDGGYISSASSSSPSSSRYNNNDSPPPNSPWARLPAGLGGGASESTTGLIASLVKEDGKVYSLAVAGDLLYTGTESDNVRVWRRDRRHLSSAFRTGSGLVKAIVVAADGRVFTGHQDGKVRVWRRASAGGDGDDPRHRRVGTLPPLGDLLVSSVNPSSYVRSRRRRRAVVWLRHSDAVSSLSLDERAGIIYSASWDRTFKAWRVSDYRCLDSVPAHDDAVNAVAAAGFAGLVLTGSADGTVKVWRRQETTTTPAAAGERTTTTRHVLQTVLRAQGGDGAVTAIAACPEARAVYVGSSDGLVTCWRWGRQDGGGEPTLAAVLQAGHGTAAGVLCLAVSGRVVVSGSADGTLCVWRRDDDERAGGHHARLAVLAGHTGPVKCVAVAADDDGCYEDERRFVVYSGSLDGSVKVWRLSEERALEQAVETTTAAPLMAAALRESEAWMPRPRTPRLPSPVQAWPPEMKGVAAA